MVVTPIRLSYVKNPQILVHFRVVVAVEVYLSAARLLVGGTDGPIFIVLAENEPRVDRV